MIIQKTLKQINRFRPDTFIYSKEYTKKRDKIKVSQGDDGSYTLDAGTYEVIFNEDNNSMGLLAPVLPIFSSNGILFDRYLYETEDGTAVLMTVTNGFLKIWPDTTIVEYFMAPAGDTVAEKRGRGRPPKAVAEPEEKENVSEESNGSE